jgi:hypothetical protein
MSIRRRALELLGGAFGAVRVGNLIVAFSPGE